MVGHFREGDGFSRDPVEGFDYLIEAYRATDPQFDGRVTVPVLWDKESAAHREQFGGRHLPDVQRCIRALTSDADDLPSLFPANSSGARRSSQSSFTKT
jgi:putative glutathione S-transferase